MKNPAFCDLTKNTMNEYNRLAGVELIIAIVFYFSQPWESFTKVSACSPYEAPLVMEPSFRGEGDGAAWRDKDYKDGMHLQKIVKEEL